MITLLTASDRDLCRQSVDAALWPTTLRVSLGRICGPRSRLLFRDLSNRVERVSYDLCQLVLVCTVSLVRYSDGN